MWPAYKNKEQQDAHVEVLDHRRCIGRKSNARDNLQVEQHYAEGSRPTDAMDAGQLAGTGSRGGGRSLKNSGPAGAR